MSRITRLASLFLLVLLPAAEALAEAMPMRYLALGDSYTIGEGVEPGQRWPVLLAQALRASGLDVAEPRIIATTGWTTDELSAAIYEAHPEDQAPWGLVSLLIGVNNQYRGRPLDEYRDQFRALLQRAIALAGGDRRRVFVLSIPDWGVTPFARERGRDPVTVATEIDAFNAAAAGICADLDVKWIDITPISRHADAKLAADGLHPGAGQYGQWAATALESLRGALPQPSEKLAN